MPFDIDQLIRDIDQIPDCSRYGRVTAVSGLMVEVGGIEKELSVGGRCIVETRDRRRIPCEVVGFRQGRALAMPFGALDGVGLGCRALVAGDQAMIHPTDAWLGRVVNALGEPVDGKGPLPKGPQGTPIRNNPPNAHSRARVGGKLDLGIRAINAFLTCCRGQRMGIFAGSGVGKSSVMSMLARFSAAEVAVIGLIGERGRELQEFITEDLGEEGLARSVVVCATSDEAPLMRKQAAYMTLAVAEHFRDQGRDVLCMMDSVTRFAMAQREIGLSAGEPPTTKGYPPTVFAELPRLLERAGPGVVGSGTITGLFTVLVDGDDHNEPIADAVRGILDGHIVMERKIGERGRYPAINILRSVSRTMPGCNTANENELVGYARRLLSSYDNMEEMIRLGAYRRGTDPQVDEAIHYQPALEAFLKQGKREATDLETSYAMLAEIFGVQWPQ
ncbi:flagellar protein export ATPase FliI (plasmid) [Azospirillum oryzae]|uniref:Flagellum-specific ATP synthase n=1 Tax=Azospirillum oryzae TaxID=286727 RepID=A0A6N1AP67_9PROT|nr:flagellar protein export ATPase FliI [Azospirillum oryzae]KAA0588582.1 flagellar protein export ATPase FliI [Azospirillum oryzae]QKS49932.1 flagellar protein export ATPase FliI [Azospirillum oryzae]GLR82774.1 flagellum-specific ATP synthase [Azospirillum oryzae]